MINFGGWKTLRARRNSGASLAWGRRGKQSGALIERPGGVLLITPESLESTFVNRTVQISARLASCDT